MHSYTLGSRLSTRDRYRCNPTATLNNPLQPRPAVVLPVLYAKYFRDKKSLTVRVMTCRVHPIAVSSGGRRATLATVSPCEAQFDPGVPSCPCTILGHLQFSMSCTDSQSGSYLYVSEANISAGAFPQAALDALQLDSHSSPLGLPSGPMAFGDWLYIRVKAVSVCACQIASLHRRRRRREDSPAGCITAQTHSPEKNDAIRNCPMPSGTPQELRYDLAKLYAGSCTDEPMAVRSMAASTPRASPFGPSAFRMTLKAWATEV